MSNENSDKITVIILNWLRPNNIKNYIIPRIIDCDLIDEIIISHGRKDTVFSYKHPKIKHRYDQENNEVFGLSLRFLVGLSSKNPNILYIDDDQVPTPLVIERMFYIYQKNFPGLVGKYGRKITDTSYIPNNISFGRVPILLTSFLFIPRDLCHFFWNNIDPIHPYVKEHSVPLWNGEDIIISLLSIIKYNKLPLVAGNNQIFPIFNLVSKKDKQVAISGNKNHLLYRSKLIREFLKLYPYFIFKTSG